jgi:heterodisulfide reductase subunit B
MTQIGPSTAFELIRRLIAEANHHQADLMATVCPMCQMNIDAYQDETNRFFHTHYKMPILFFTQLIGLALGIDPKRLGFGKEFVSARAALSRIGVDAPESEEAAPVRKPSRRDKNLPMPRMPGQEDES